MKRLGRRSVCRAEVARALEVDRIDLVEREEGLDLHRFGLLRMKLVEFLLCDSDVVILAHAVAFDDVVFLHDLLAGCTPPVYLDHCPTRTVELLELDVLSPSSGITFHCDCHETEREKETWCSDCGWHVGYLRVGC